MRRPVPRRQNAPQGSVRAKIDEQQAASIDTDFEHTSSRDIVAAPPSGITGQSKSLVVSLRRSELDSQLAFALHHPRPVNRAMESMHRYATISEEAAATMTYSIPRGGKMIEGPSVRFAELIKQAWGHSKSTAHITEVNREAMYVEAEGIFFDLESNTETSSVVRRSIRDKYGRCFSDDMIVVTGNAACAIAKRNAILEGIPRPLWENAHEAAKQRAAGGVEGIQKKRQDMLRTFLRAGVAPDRILASLGLISEAHIKLEHINILRGRWGSLQSGEATIDELFPPIQAVVSAETDQAQTKPKTLADLADGEDEALNELRSEILDNVRDKARRAYHKGIYRAPDDIASNDALAEVWQEVQDELSEQENANEDALDDADEAGENQAKAP